MQGEVTFLTVRALKDELEKLPEKINIELNFCAVTKVDSAAISFLIFALQNARERGSALKILNVTDTMEKLIKLYGVENFLDKQQ